MITGKTCKMKKEKKNYYNNCNYIANIVRSAMIDIDAMWTDYLVTS